MDKDEIGLGPKSRPPDIPPSSFSDETMVDIGNVIRLVLNPPPDKDELVQHAQKKLARYYAPRLFEETKKLREILGNGWTEGHDLEVPDTKQETS